VLTADLEPDNLERFVREQIAMGKLSGHPHIDSIFQVGTTATGRPYIVMQYHPHGSMEAKIHDAGPIGWRGATSIGVKLAGALETAHRRGTLHRDVKPANILLTEYGEPQLTDFGIARITGGFETADGAIMGSPAYTAPEVLLGEPPDVTSDVCAARPDLVGGHEVLRGERVLRIEHGRAGQAGGHERRPHLPLLREQGRHHRGDRGPGHRRGARHAGRLLRRRRRGGGDDGSARRDSGTPSRSGQGGPAARDPR
jgi:hypothetical protein